MKIVIIGYGRMGKEIEKTAIERGHEISKIFDVNNQDEFTTDQLRGSDIAIEFTLPATASHNIIKCFEANLPVVSGTTGWLSEYKTIEKKCIEDKQAFFYAPNFSIGVNVFRKLNKELAKWMNKLKDYNVSMEEIHHIHKKDTPSGTAVALADDIIEIHKNKDSWIADPSEKIKDENIPIFTHRENMMPGTHKIKWNSDVDTIEIVHTAKNRKGFALGAILAAEYLVDKKGVYSMSDLLDF